MSRDFLRTDSQIHVDAACARKANTAAKRSTRLRNQVAGPVNLHYAGEKRTHRQRNTTPGEIHGPTSFR